MQQQTNERNLLGGYDMMATMFPMMNFGNFILGWYAVTLEVFLRREFGERYFNRINYWAGNFGMAIMMALSAIAASAGTTLRGVTGAASEAIQESSDSGFGLLTFIWFMYNVLSGLHFLRTWWRNQSGNPIHSLDPGKSRLRWLARPMMRVINMGLDLLVRFYVILLVPEEEQERVSEALPILDDENAFTERTVEPLTMAFLG